MEIIYDIDVLAVPSEPLTFLTEQGAKTEEGEEIIRKIIYSIRKLWLWGVKKRA